MGLNASPQRQTFASSDHQTFSPESFFFVHVILILEQEVIFLSRLPYETGPVDNNTGLPAASGAWKACVLVVPGLFLAIPTSFLTIEGYS